MSRAIFAAFLTAVLAGCGSVSVAADEPADLVVLDGQVLTLDEASSQAEAVAIRDGRFVRVGSSEAVGELIGENTQVIDAEGSTVIPGLIETHVHAIRAAQNEAVQPFYQLGSIEQMQDWVREQVPRTEADEWIQLPRVDVTRIREGRMPTRQELDAATADQPVVFTWRYADRQVQVLNTAALDAAGITAETEAPEGGRIRLDDDGEPTGVVEDAGSLISEYLRRPSVSEEEHLDSLEQLLGLYNAVGITSIFERNTNVEGYRIYQRMREDERLPVRVTTTIRLSTDGTVEGTEQAIRDLPISFGEGDDRVKVGPLKVGVDGGVLYGTAFLREPYGERAFDLYGFDDPDYRGSMRLDAEQLKNIIRTGHRLGWQMSAHVTGDAGVDAVLDAVEAADADSPIRDMRYTLIHAYFPNPETAERAARLGVCVDTQPGWYYKDGDALAEALGPDRMSRFIGLNTWREAGVTVAINADHMRGFDPDLSLNPYNPFLTMYIAATRRTEGGQVMNPEQQVSREEALRMMTSEAARLSFDEDNRGSIEVGKLGDLAVLTDNPLTCDAEQLKEIRASLTVVGGEVVHEATAP